MLAANERITLRQLQILIVLGALGTGVIVLPRRVAQFAGQDGWVIVIGLVLVAALIGLLISTAVFHGSKQRPGEGFIGFTSALLTRPVAYVLGFVLWIKLIFAVGLELRVFLEITNVIMLPQTPIAVVGVVMLLPCVYAAAKGIETRARVAEVLFAVMALPFIFLVALAIFDTDFSNLQPVLVTPPVNYLNGVLGLGFVFTGLECLLLVSPFVKKGKHMGRHVVSAILLAGFLILIITVLTIAKFGTGVAAQPWPVLRMMDMINIPGSFIERQEALVFSFWIITAFVICNAMLFFGNVLVKDIFKPHIKHLGVYLTAACALAVAVFPWNTAAYEMLDFMYITVGAFYLVVLPLVILIVALIKNRKKIAVAPLLLCLVFALSGCWDRVEIENRAYVVAIGVDMEEDEYSVTLSIPLLAQNNQDEAETPGFLQTATGGTITEALKHLEQSADKTLYYGQAKVLILGQDVIKNPERTAGVIRAFNSLPEIDLRINVLGTEGTAKEILETEPPGEDLPGLFVADIYRNKDKLGGESFAIDIERLWNLYNNGVLLPLINTSEDEGAPLNFEGAVAIKDGDYKGEISGDELEGILWCLTNGSKGAVINVDVNDETIPVQIKAHRAKIIFEEWADGIQATVKINVKTEIKEPSETDEKETRRQLAYYIEESVLTAANHLQNTIGVDAYQWLDLLRKKNYKLYLQHRNDWETVFSEIHVNPIVYVK